MANNDAYAWASGQNANRVYAANGLNQYASSGPRCFDYNVNGTNGLNQLTSAGATALGYDGRGNLTSSGSSTYSYTSENRLATAPGGVTLTYDPTGRLSLFANKIPRTIHWTCLVNEALVGGRIAERRRITPDRLR